MSPNTKKWLGLVATIAVSTLAALYIKHAIDVYVLKSVVIPASAATSSATTTAAK